MGSLWSWLLAAVLPLAKKVLIGLGFGIVTYSGVSALSTAVINNVQFLIGEIPAEVAQFIALFGVFDAASIMLGAIAARASLAAVKKLGILTA